MKYKQIKLRLDILILKDKQSIRGYSLSILNTKNLKWSIIMGRLEASIKRKEEALKYIKMNSKGKFNWKEVCSKFKFKSYRQ